MATVEEAAVTIQNLVRIIISGRMLLDRARKHVFRTKIASELFTTEVTYCHDLDNLIHVHDKLKEVVDEATLEKIFCNVPEIQKIHHDLRGLTTDKLDNWNFDQTIGDIFYNIDFTPYEKFMNNYEISMNELIEEKKKKKVLKVLQDVQKDCRGLNIESLLITPVQRLPRYVMLLEQMINKTGTKSKDYDHLNSSKVKIQTLLDYFNESKRRKELSEEAAKVLTKFKKNVYGIPEDILSDQKMLIKEGVMFISTGSTTQTLDFIILEKPFYVYLFSDCIIIAKSQSKKVSEKMIKSFKFQSAEVLQFADIDLTVPQDTSNVAAFTVVVKRIRRRKKKPMFAKNINYGFHARDPMEKNSWKETVKAYVESEKKFKRLSKNIASSRRGGSGNFTSELTSSKQDLTSSNQELTSSKREDDDDEISDDLNNSTDKNQ